MIYGDLDGVVAVPLRPDDDPEEYRQRVKEKLDALPEGSLVMVDLLGGTPSNSIMRLVRDSGVCVLSGASMPMLIEAATLRSAHLGRELLELVVEKGHDGIVNITQLLEGA
jgi:mannose/fructose-specific phosphotransferase system component IIA